jgi:hypothetical protein
MGDWVPDRTGIEARKECFPRDWGNLLDWPPLDGGEVIADGSVRNIASSGGIPVARRMPEFFPDIDALVARFRYASAGELLARVSADPNVVWMSCGAPMCMPEVLKEQNAAAMESVRSYSVVGCSIFDMGYAGISLFEGKTGRRLALIYGDDHREGDRHVSLAQ